MITLTTEGNLTQKDKARILCLRTLPRAQRHERRYGECHQQVSKQSKAQWSNPVDKHTKTGSSSIVHLRQPRCHFYAHVGKHIGALENMLCARDVRIFQTTLGDSYQGVGSSSDQVRKIFGSSMSGTNQTSQEEHWTAKLCRSWELTPNLATPLSWAQRPSSRVLFASTEAKAKLIPVRAISFSDSFASWLFQRITCACSSTLSWSTWPSTGKKQVVFTQQSELSVPTQNRSHVLDEENFMLEYKETCTHVLRRRGIPTPEETSCWLQNQSRHFLRIELAYVICQDDAMRVKGHSDTTFENATQKRWLSTTTKEDKEFFTLVNLVYPNPNPSCIAYRPYQDDGACARTFWILPNAQRCRHMLQHSPARQIVTKESSIYKTKPSRTPRHTL